FKLTVTENTISLTSDLVASRTVWYYLDEDTFIASSSQRMIIAALQRFDINTQAIVWMLSTGSLGPGHSWDRHIRQLAPDTVLSVRKSSILSPETSVAVPIGDTGGTGIGEIFDSVFSTFDHEAKRGVTLSG